MQSFKLKYIVLFFIVVSFSGNIKADTPLSNIKESDIEYLDNNTQDDVVVKKFKSKAVKLKRNTHKIYYSKGAFYSKTELGYKVINPPLGVSVKKLPKGYERIIKYGRIIYFCNGVFYKQVNKKLFIVSDCPDGITVNNKPDHSQYVKIKGEKYLLCYNILYKVTYDRAKEVYVTAGTLNTYSGF